MSGNYFVPNQGGLNLGEKPEEEPEFTGFPATAEPLWPAADGAVSKQSVDQPSIKLPDFSKGGRRLW
jgi:hypothetical protein